MSLLVVMLNGKDEQIFNIDPKSIDFELTEKIILGGPDSIRSEPLKRGLGLSPSHLKRTKCL